MRYIFLQCLNVYCIAAISPFLTLLDLSGGTTPLTLACLLIPGSLLLLLILPVSCLFEFSFIDLVILPQHPVSKWFYISSAQV